MSSQFKPRLIAAACSAVGALTPDILMIYSKRWTTEQIALPHTYYIGAILLYALVAAIVGGIYPYKPQPTPWKAFAVGAGTPIVLGAIAGAAKPISLAPRGMQLSQTFWDLISLW